MLWLVSNFQDTAAAQCGIVWAAIDPLTVPVWVCSKNIYDLKFDELNLKKLKFEKKILMLNQKILLIETNKHERNDGYNESKKYLVNLQKNLKNIN